MHSSLRIRQIRIAYLFLLPAIIVFVLGLIVPLINTLELSFNELSMGSPWDEREFINLENYQRMFSDPGVQTSVGVTLRFAAFVLIAELVIGLALALLLEKPIRGAAIFRTIFILPLMVSPVAVGLIWRYLLDGRIGLVNFYLNQIGIPSQTWLGEPGLAFFSIVITDIWQWTPFIFIILLAGLQALPSEVLEASRIDGANWWQMTFLIKLPMLRSILLVTVLMRLIDVFRALEVIFILTFGGPGRSTQVLSLHIYKTAFTSQALGYASTIAVMLMFIMLILSMVLMVISNPFKEKSDF
ncbi:MAG: sugar ABC transporter permease [Chloroflexi bacterium]|nr:sugar ABC transporter permease [Chloroflexota bacterium]